MTKRRFIEQLPNRLRTEDLSKFFSATVDHVFQPGKAEPISGYIGRYPSYFDGERDFYIQEPTFARAVRQLEPVMATASETAITRVLFYDDLVSHIAAEGGETDNNIRLFDTKHYSWAPPVDLGKLSSPQNYYWFGANPREIPGLLLSSPIMRHRGNNVTFTFEMPPVIEGYTSEDESVAAWVNNTKVTVVSSSATHAVLENAPPVGAVVEIYRYGNIENLLVGKASFDPSPFVNPTVYYRVTNGQTNFTPPSAVLGYPNSQADHGVFLNGAEVPSSGFRFTNDGDISLRGGSVPDAGDVVRVIRNRDHALGLTKLSNSMRLVFNDEHRRAPGFDIHNFDTKPWDDVRQNTFLVEGVGEEIELFDFDMVSRYAQPTPNYVVMDRRCRDGNPWARFNLWVHREAFQWAHVLFSDKVARRPIIEFQRDIQLHRHGRRNIGSVDRVLSDTGYDENGPLDSAAQINGRPNGSIFVDGNGDIRTAGFDVHNFDTRPWDQLNDENTRLPLEIGHRLLIRGEVDGRDDLSNSIVRVVEAINGDGETVMALEPEAPAEIGDVVSVGLTIASFYFTGDSWEATQTFNGNSTPPLFTLYDVQNVALDDQGFFPENDFVGSRLFAYATNPDNSVDPILGLPLRYDALGQIVFENLINTQVVNYRDGQVEGTKFYRVLGETASSDEFRSDWHPIADPSVIAANEVPMNLQANPDNEQITLISKNEWLDHFRALIGNQEGFEGDPFGLNNWHNTPRDLTAVNGNIPLRIVQHDAPMLKLMLLAGDFQFDFMESARFVEGEYARFRSRFIHNVMLSYMDGSVLDTDSSSAIVNTVLRAMKLNKNSEFPFTLNTLGDPSGRETFFIPPTPTAIGVAPSAVPALETDYSFAEPVSMLRGHDGSRMPLYSDNTVFFGDGSTVSFILASEPAGPATVKVNGTVVTSSLAGKVVTLSAAPAAGATVEVSISDIRDRAMLALEELIYQSLPAKFRAENNNTGSYRGFELVSWLEGRFRNDDRFGYSRGEFVRILTPMFLRWAQKNGFDYRINNTYEQSDPFTWNYSTSADRYGDVVPGHWRGIYDWYFDTDRPHICPWEMLGFAQKPIWWDAEYGQAPYTLGNTKLWEHLRDGRIAQGPRAGIDARYARPDLLDVLPVDDSGDLLDPMAAGIIPVAPTFHQATRSWVFGDGGPVEHLWRMSPSFPFAIAQAAYLMKPARFVEFTWDTLNYETINNQWLNVPAGKRVSNNTITVHGERDEDGSRQPVVGIQQWVSERMISQGQEPAIFGDAVRAVGVRLGHKMAGFTASDNLRVVADNFGLVPDEDVNVVLYASPNSRQEFYSGVIVEWSGTGWRVFGYDALNPFFNVELPDHSSSSAVVSTSTVPELVVLDWKANVNYAGGLIAEYKGSLYECIRTHTSTSKFEQEFWEARPNLRRPEAPRVNKYLLSTGEQTTVAYGSEFQTYQELADFIFGYERYLESRGWVFDGIDEDGPNDWVRVVKDFLDWSTIQWEPGNFIALSPGATGLKFVTDHGTIYSLEQAFSGAYGIVDRDGMPLHRRDTFVSRIDGEVTIRSREDDLFGVRLNVGEIEHALLFSNTTIFSDVIYKPLFDLRQERLRINGQRALDWKGRLDAPGYVISNDNIVANFDTAAEDIRTAFDIEGAGSPVLRDHARHLVGYESRGYLRDLLLSETQQFEFHQGMIQQKGSAGTFGKMLRSQFIEQDRNLRFLEEWAFKASSYGAIDATKRYAFQLHQKHIERNPQLVSFAAPTAAETDVHYVPVSEFISGMERLPNVFPTRSTYRKQPGDLPNAGYARLDEVEYTAFNYDGVANLYQIVAAADGKAFANGERVWVYDGHQHDWEILRSTNLRQDGGENTIQRIEVSDDGSFYGARIVLAHPHGLTEADRGKLIVIDGEARSKTDLRGIQRIFDFGDNWVEIETGVRTGYRWVVDENDSFEVTQLPTANDPENAPKVRILQNVRFADLASLSAADWWTPVTGELVYLDTDPNGSTEDPNWVVRIWDGANWDDVYRVQPYKVDSTAILGSLIYDTVSNITTSRLISEPLVVDRLVVIDPMVGLIPGEAERELTYKLEYDPARYNRGSSASDSAWSSEQIGELWWDLSTVRFLNPETDAPEGEERTIAEQHYRVDNWGKVAPGSSVDVWEWTRSTVSPLQFSGEVYQSASPNWVETEEFDPVLNRLVPVYFFWTKGNREVSRLARDRRLDSVTVSRIIANATSLDIPWIAATFPDALLVGGTSQHLNAESTVLQIDVRLLEGDARVHTEWSLLRPQDSRSQPNRQLWSKMIDSLSGVDRFKRQVPDPSLNRHASQGIEVRPRQSLFGGTADARVTLRQARESLTGMLNIIFAREDVVRQRVNPVQQLLSLADRFPTRNETANTPAVLAWSSQDSSESSLPSPSEYDVEVFNRIDRDNLLVSSDFVAARAEGQNARPRRVLINGLEAQVPFWSVWEYDPRLAAEKFTYSAVGDGSTTEFDLDFVPVRKPIRVTRQTVGATDAAVLIDGIDFTISGSFITFATAPRISETVIAGGTTIVGDNNTTEFALPKAPYTLVAVVDNTAVSQYRVSGTTIEFLVAPTSSVAINDDGARIEYADTLFNLANAYSSVDCKVAGRAERDAGTFAVGDIVLVDSDSGANGFWTLWKYLPADPLADAQGFVLLRAQDYRVSDFIEIIDWYAEGYGPENPPVTSFATRLARDNAMGDNPTTTFVRIENDGAEAPYSGWMWTAYENGAWVVVAREKRTIRLKDDAFSRLDLPVSQTRYATGPGYPRHFLENITTREGAMELRTILRFLIDEVLTEDESNELFFSLVHFAHSHLDQVNWAFKTSFLYVGGYNESLTQTPIQRADNTESLLSYIDEVKPYRVKTRDFARGLAPPVDESNLEATDFDKPRYFDPVQRRFRRLNPLVSADVEILRTGAYRRWYENYLKTGYDLRNYSPQTWNPIRRLKTTLAFDRVDGWETGAGTFFPSFVHGGTNSGSAGTFTISSNQSFANVTVGMRVLGTNVGTNAKVVEIVQSGAIRVSVANTGPVSGPLTFVFNNAAKRMVDHYNPIFPGQRENRLETLLGLDFKGTVLDGDTIAARSLTDIDLDGNAIEGAVEINGDNEDGVTSLGINDPKSEENRPEELVLLGNQDYVAFTVHSIGRPGAPAQANKFFDVTNEEGETAVLTFSEIAQSNDAVAVFRDGVRADPPFDYTIDHFKREVVVNMMHGDGSRVQRVSLHIFGVGGLTRIVEQRFYTFGPGDSQTLYVSPRDGSLVVEAFINGEPVDAMANFSSGAVTLSETINELDDVLLNVREVPQSAAAPEIKVMVEELPYAPDGIWQISNWQGNRPDAHALAIVELDGIRLMPPETKYLRVGSGFRWALVDNVPLSGSDYDYLGYDTTEYDVATAERLLWNIYVGDEEYLGEVPDLSDLYDSPEAVVGYAASLTEQFAYWRGYIVCVDEEILIDDVVVVINQGHDYTIDRDGVLTILNPPEDLGESRVRVTTFTHIPDIGIETWTYKGRADGNYPIYRPHAGEYLWLTVNGKKQVFDVDFNLLTGAEGDYDGGTTGWDTTEWDNDNSFASTAGNWDLFAWDTPEQEWDSEPAAEPVVYFVRGHAPQDEVVITVFKKAPLRLPKKFLSASVVPGKSIQHPVEPGGNVFSMEGGWEYLNVREGHTGVLLTQLAETSTSVTVALPDYSLDLYSDPWFVTPQPDAPGVAWVNGERIEYSTLTEELGQVTLSGLVRSSKGTAIRTHPAGSQVIAAVSPFTPRNSAL